MKNSSRWCALVALAVFTLTGSIVYAGSGRSVPVMTAFTVKLDEAVRPERVANGTPFTATLKQPVEVDGRVMIPAGASAGGILSKESENSAEMELNSVFVNGHMYRITTEPVSLNKRASFRAGSTVTFYLLLSLNIDR
jgi:hypothetical protein